MESLIEHPALMTHASIPAEQRARLGIREGLIRLSVGIEDAEGLRADLQLALDNIWSGVSGKRRTAHFRNAPVRAA